MVCRVTSALSWRMNAPALAGRPRVGDLAVIRGLPTFVHFIEGRVAASAASRGSLRHAWVSLQENLVHVV